MSFLDFLKYEPKVFSRKAGFFAGALAGLVMGLLGVIFFGLFQFLEKKLKV